MTLGALTRIAGERCGANLQVKYWYLVEHILKKGLISAVFSRRSVHLLHTSLQSGLAGTLDLKLHLSRSYFCFCGFLIESTESLECDARRVEILIHGRIIEHVHHI